jgi:ABC-2 type transport system permease protein
MMFFYDTTYTKECTITEGSQEIMKLLKGNVTMTTYVNAIGKYNYMLPPSSINSNLKRYKQFRRFSPQIKIKYKYYFDVPESTRYEQLYDIYPEARSLEDFNRYMCRIFQIDTNIVMKPAEIRNVINLEPEYNRMVTHIVHESGKSTFLRVFDDIYVLPNEAEVSAAFKRIVSDIQKVAFIEGNGERSIYNTSDSHYEYFSSDKRFRSSLINNGFDICTHTLDKPVPEDISIVVLADPREKLDETENKNLQEFIDRGGNLLLTGEPHRLDVFNSIAEGFGVKALPGCIVRESKSVQADLILSQLTKPATKIFYKFVNMYYRGINVSMPTVSALEYTEDKGYKVTPLLTSDTIHTWIEHQTTDFVEDTVKFNPEKGDIKGTFTTALTLTRQVNDKEQRIVMFNDADCISNGEVFRNRTGLKIANNSFLEGIFYYLSGDEVPVNMFRPNPIDRSIRIGIAGFEIAKILIWWGIPVVIAIFGIILWIRRRGK